MPRSPQPITIKSLVFTILATALVWLPMVNALADGKPTSDNQLLLFTTILADAGLCGLIWLNWLLRRNK